MKDKKKVYEPPQLMDFGRLTHITANLGMTLLTDAEGTGSMIPSGKGGGTGGGT